MAYYTDFSEYHYIRPLVYHPFLPHIRRMGPQLNIGWLSPEHPFPQGSTSPELIEKIWAFSAYQFWPTRGIHACEFCAAPVMHRQPSLGMLGSAEIRVRAPNCWYACPNLIVHYIEAHNYRPPDDFAEAVAKGPAPFTVEYEKALDDLVLATQHGRRVTPRTE